MMRIRLQIHITAHKLLLMAVGNETHTLSLLLRESYYWGPGTVLLQLTSMLRYSDCYSRTAIEKKEERIACSER